MVDRCVCINVTFESLRTLREERGLSLEELKEQTGCCSGCAMCEPYIRTMLKTGRTSFAPMTPMESAAAMRE